MSPGGITFATRREPVAMPDPDEGPDVAALVVRAKLGDSEAFSQLYRLHLRAIYGFAITRLTERDAAEEATQAIFFRALSSLSNCRDNAAFPAWLFAIARSVVGDHQRTYRFRLEPIDLARESLDPTPGPEEKAIQNEASRLLGQARDKCLSERDRELFDLLLTDLNDKEIATLLGKGHGATRTAHWRLLNRLRDCLSKLTWVSRIEHTHV